MLDWVCDQVLGQSCCLQEAFPGGLYEYSELPLIALLIFKAHLGATEL